MAPFVPICHINNYCVKITSRNLISNENDPLQEPMLLPSFTSVIFCLPLFCSLLQRRLPPGCPRMDTSFKKWVSVSRHQDI